MQLLQSSLPIFTFQILFFAFSSCLLCSGHSCHPNDQASLLDIKDALHQSGPSLGWMTSTDCCQWEGVYCNQDGRVSELKLYSSGLNGQISPSIGNLTTLTILDMTNNNLVGSIPQEIGDLAYLERLDLSSNQLGGATPPSVINCTCVKYINLSSNILMEDLFFLNFSGLANLNSLDLSDNHLTGALSFQIFSALPNLHHLDLSYNHLSGGVSFQYFSGLANLSYLDLGYNQLSGTMSFQNFSGLTNLGFLYLNNNQLLGALSFQSFSSTELACLNLSYNHLSGALSSIGFSNLTQLHTLCLNHNNFIGEFPHSLYSCRYVEVHNNQLVGVQSVPNITSLSCMSYLSIRDNNLNNLVEVIQSLMQIKTLRFLDVANNFLRDDKQDTDQVVMLPKSHSLLSLSLRGCALSRIPTWLTKLHELQTIDLSFNKIAGPIPIWLGTLPQLSKIDLPSNLISGQIPVELCSLPTLKLDSDIQEACHSLWVYNDEINWLWEYENEDNCVPSLNLSNNKLTGNIPQQIASLYFLESLDLSYNALSGEIPVLLYHLQYLKKFDVSYNYLEGPIPLGGRSDEFTSSSYRGNSGLCGVPLLTDCSVEEETKAGAEEDHKELEKLWFGIGVAFGYLTGFFGVCYSLLCSTTWRNAYFNFLIHLKDQVYVFIAIRVARYRRN